MSWVTSLSSLQSLEFGSPWPSLLNSSTSRYDLFKRCHKNFGPVVVGRGWESVWLGSRRHWHFSALKWLGCGSWRAQMCSTVAPLCWDLGKSWPPPPTPISCPVSLGGSPWPRKRNLEDITNQKCWQQHIPCWYNLLSCGEFSGIRHSRCGQNLVFCPFNFTLRLRHELSEPRHCILVYGLLLWSHHAVPTAHEQFSVHFLVDLLNHLGHHGHLKNPAASRGSGKSGQHRLPSMIPTPKQGQLCAKKEHLKRT